jgi:hypothetical protein
MLKGVCNDTLDEFLIHRFLGDDKISKEMREGFGTSQNDLDEMFEELKKVGLDSK